MLSLWSAAVQICLSRCSISRPRGGYHKVNSRYLPMPVVGTRVDFPGAKPQPDQMQSGKPAGKWISEGISAQIELFKTHHVSSSAYSLVRNCKCRDDLHDWETRYIYMGRASAFETNRGLNHSFARHNIEKSCPMAPSCQTVLFSSPQRLGAINILHETHTPTSSPSPEQVV